MLTFTRIHPASGTTLTRRVREETFAVAEHTIAADIPGWFSDDDSLAMYDYADQCVIDRIIETLRAQAE